MLVTQGATQDPPFVCTPLEMAPSTKKRFQREQIQTKRYRDMVIAYAAILELLQKSPVGACVGISQTPRTDQIGRSCLLPFWLVSWESPLIKPGIV